MIEYFVVYFMNDDEPFICSTLVELNRTINNYKDLLMIKESIAKDKNVDIENIVILNVMRFPI